MRLPGFTETNTVTVLSASMARINVGGIGRPGWGVLRNPDCYCDEVIWVCDQWSCHGACLRWVCP
jgi:hypothetical protein